MDTAEFLTRIKLHAMIPDASEDYPDAQILAEATQALYERYSQALGVLRNGYWLHRKVLTLTAGQNFYRMPARAIVQGLEKLEIAVDSAASSWRQLSILTDSQASDYDARAQQGAPGWFSLESDGVILYPTPSTALSLRMSFYLRPSVLVETLSLGVVVSATPTLVTVTGDISAVLSAGQTMDIVNNTGCNEVIVMDQPVGTITSIGGGQWTVATTGLDVSRVTVGALVRKADTTDQIPLPIELHSSLVDWTGAAILMSTGDMEKAQQLLSKAEAATKRIVDQAVPRVKARPYVVKTRNTLLRRKLGYGFGFR